MTQLGFIEHIVRAKKKNKLIILCGAGVSIAATKNATCASWAGLIQYGLDWCAANNIILQGENGLQRARHDFKDKDYISAADKLHRGLLASGEWTRFIGDTFKNLTLIDSQLIKIIKSLDTPIITTNYDTLIESAIGVPSQTWKYPLFQQCMKDIKYGVGHIHGVWTDSDSIIFNSSSYDTITANTMMQTLERSISLSHTLLLIGVGDGLGDPNVGGLLNFLNQHFFDKGILHYQLVTKQEAEDSTQKASILKKISYGETYNDLLPFMQKLSESCGCDIKIDLSIDSCKLLNAADILRTPLLPSFDKQGPTFEQLWPDLLIDVAVKNLKSFNLNLLYASDLTDQDLSSKTIAVIGPPGSGKSTLLHRMVLEEDARNNKIKFISAHDLATFSPTNLTSIDETLVIDGLDELGVSSLETVALIIESLKKPYWISCRKDFYSKKSSVKKILNAASYVFEVQPLTDEQVFDFINQFSQKTGCFDAQKIIIAWLNNNEFNKLLHTPLNLILALFIASGHSCDSDIDQPPNTKFELYDMFYNHFLRYEGKRIKLSPKDIYWINNRHISIAKNIYKSRQGYKVSIQQHRELKVNSKESVVDILLNKKNKNGKISIQFWHETYMEYLLSRDFVDTLKSKSRKKISISLAFNDDVNSFIREAFSHLSDEQRKETLKHLSTIYLESNNCREAEHALYYIGRLQMDTCPDILKQAFHNDKNILSHRAAALGAILHGEIDIETEFMKELEQSAELDLINRSVQLIYFGDVRGDLHEFKDNGCSWARTRDILFTRIADENRRSIQLRWWDLQTLRSFFKHRKDHIQIYEKNILCKLVEEYSHSSNIRDLQMAHVVSEILKFHYHLGEAYPGHQDVYL
ncbi:MAG: SIR2 family protein [Holosporales bacterium]|jgi:hypothetical protein|nr:SIR2 family protein [Holosporales bacterium]